MNPLLQTNVVDAHIGELRRLSTTPARPPKPPADSIVVRLRHKLGRRIVVLGLQVMATNHTRSERLRLLQ
ncbi:MAG TPA: hypothetical protein VGF87_03310 [Acidimicrobiales bacterium]|jgi:hypothetical protein